jgi:hypothetical protein
LNNLNSWAAQAKRLKEHKDAAQEKWDDATEISEASDRCGMDSRHTLSGVVLVETESGDEWGVQYHWVCAPIRFIATRGILFQFECEDGLFKVEIEGDDSPESIEKLRMISRQLTWAKRALLSANGSTVKAVRIEKIEDEKEEGEET